MAHLTDVGEHRSDRPASFGRSGLRAVVAAERVLPCVPVILPSGVPSEAQDLLTQILAEPLVPVHQLRGELRAHLATIEAAAAKNEFLDTSLATRLSQVCDALLDEAERQNADAVRRLVQSAVRYFILDDNGEHDLESVCGLDDDAQVCNAVARHIGRDDLVIQV